MSSRPITEHDLVTLSIETEGPVMPLEAGYWRILDNGGNVLLQGDGK